MGKPNYRRRAASLKNQNFSTSTYKLKLASTPCTKCFPVASYLRRSLRKKGFVSIFNGPPWPVLSHPAAS